MKRFLGILFFVTVNAAALIVAVSCANNSPNSAFVSPVKTISASNPTWSPTPSPTFTWSPTATPAFPVSGFNQPMALAIVPVSGGVEYVGDSTNGGLIRQYNAGILNTGWPNGKAKPNVNDGVSYPSPRAMAADASGNLYVVGGGTGVYKFLSTGDLSVAYNANLSNASGLACSSTTLFVSDTGHQQIVTFPLTGGAATTILSGTTTPAIAYTPMGLALNSAGNKLYVVGQGTNSSSVYVYSNSSGWSLTATIPGFNNAYAVAVDGSGNVFVSDTGNRQVEEFTVNNYSQAPASVYGSGILISPEAISTDSLGNIYVVDSGTDNFYEFIP